MILRLLRRNFSSTRIRYIYQSEKIDGSSSSSSGTGDSRIPLSDNASRESRDRILKDLLESSSAFVDTKPQHDQDKWATLPYVDGTIMTERSRDELDIGRPRIDPRDTSIILFPGDGAQFVGMAKSIDSVPAAKDIFDYASEVLKFDLLKLCNGGPKYKLNDIRYGHAAIMTASLANLEALREERPNTVYNCVGTAGFSVGEITALVFAGAFQFDQALQLVQIRAEAIHAACEMYKGATAQISFRPDSDIIKACKQAKQWCIDNNVEQAECVISNFLCPRLKLLAGSEEAIQYLEENYRKFRLRFFRRVPNLPAYHSALMEPTIEPIKTALHHMDINDPIIQVYSNITCRPYFNANHIKQLLPQQLVNPMKWEQTMTYLYARRRGIYFPRTIVCGPGLNLRNILKEVNFRAWRESKHFGDIPKKKKKKRFISVTKPIMLFK